jgi:hypothetical protein
MATGGISDKGKSERGKKKKFLIENKTTSI